MDKTMRTLSHFLLTLSVIPSLSAQGNTVNVDTGWLPVTEAEKALKAPIIDNNAGAEAIFWRTHVWDELTGSDWQRIYSHYARIKVFNDKGKEQVSTVDITTLRRDTAVISINARTIKPDGTIVEMPKDAVKDREVFKAGGIAVRAKSFTLPAVEAGSIIEYRYREIAFKENIIYLRGHFQHNIPVHQSTFFIKPLPQDIVPLKMGVLPFNCRPSPLKIENNGFNSMTLEKVPAFREEPNMPGEASVRPWVLFFYADNLRREPERYWQKIGKEAYNELKESLKLNNEIKAAAAKATASSANDAEKVVALITYLRANLRDLFSSAVSVAERGKVLKSMPKTRRRTSAEVFESGIGTSDELNTLFAAMAQSVGLEARPVRVGNINDIHFHPNLADIHFLDSIDMAVNIGGQWKIYDVSTRELPPHMIGWREEGAKALLSDPKTPQFIDVPFSPPQASRSLRTGNFRLDADGVLEGDVVLEYTGHRASERRIGRMDEPAEKIVESFKSSLEKSNPGAELTNVKVENMQDSAKPLRYTYRIKIPGYAQRTGKRLFLQPFYFQRNTTPVFPSSERVHDVQFPYAWEEEDKLRIELPEGFKLENAESPGSLNFGRPGEYKVEMRVANGNALMVTRILTFGADGYKYFPKESYSQLKSVFDEFHRRDTHMLALRSEQ
ncbi:MAG: DUF3857 and transglutaminase domain-containing protein [Bryobacterales bacterium]|nr:DUF3857 and transglutaminase domain-containing protein [Bryobacterales bacterium]